MRHLVFCLFIFFATSLWGRSVRILVKNPCAFQRNEVLSIPVVKLQKALKEAPSCWVVHDASGLILESQVTYDSLYLFPVEIIGKGSQTYTISTGERQTYQSSVFIQKYPGRLDDVAWENDCIAFRCFGPALQHTGERSYGFDVWVKKTSDLVVNGRYARELNPQALERIAQLRKTDPQKAREVAGEISYRVNHGDGLDCYKVGPTLGCGTPALLDLEGNIRYPWCYKECEILDRGPLRVTFRASYPDTCGTQETRIISLDRYSQLCRLQVTYRLKHFAQIVAGIVIHKEDSTTYTLVPQKGYMAYADRTDRPSKQNGLIYTGCVFPEKVDKMELRRFNTQERKNRRDGDFGHILAYLSTAQATYYFGAAWSKFNIISYEAWLGYLDRFSESLKKPLHIQIQ